MLLGSLLLLFLMSPRLVESSGQRVITAIDCEVTNGRTTQWYYTRYGPNGGSNSYQGYEGRLFEQDCQTAWCFDTEGERGHWMFNCGYAWRDGDDMEPSDSVVVDVLAVAHNHYDSTCPSGYKTVAHWDSEGHWATGTNMNNGHHSFQLCTRSLSWQSVANQNARVVTDVHVKPANTAGTYESYSNYYLVGSWDTNNNWNNYVYDGQSKVSWAHKIFLFQKKQYPEITFLSTIAYWSNYDSDDSSNVGSRSSITYESSFTTSRSTHSENEQLNSFTESTSFTTTIGMTSEAGFGDLTMSGKFEQSLTQSFEQTSASRALNSITNIGTASNMYSKTVHVPAEPWVLYSWKLYRNANIGYGAELSTMRTIVKSGPCRHIAPNCAPGFCADSECFTCTTQDAVIDPNFDIPSSCSSTGRLLREIENNREIMAFDEN